MDHSQNALLIRLFAERRNALIALSRIPVEHTTASGISRAAIHKLKQSKFLCQMDRIIFVSLFNWERFARMASEHTNQMPAARESLYSFSEVAETIAIVAISRWMKQ